MSPQLKHRSNIKEESETQFGTLGLESLKNTHIKVENIIHRHSEEFHVILKSETGENELHEDGQPVNENKDPSEIQSSN